MSVSTDTHTKSQPLAGSDESTAALGGSDPGERRLAPEQDAGGLHAGAGRLWWTCERCNRRVGGVGAGFAAVDLRETDAAAHGRLTRAGVDGAVVTAKAQWAVLHAKCAPEVTKPLNPYFRIWIERVRTVDELLDAVAELSRLPWFSWSDWGGLVRRVLADTDRVAGESAALREERAQGARERAEQKRARNREHMRRKKQRGIAPDDPRHGKASTYNNFGCRCDPCTQAAAEAQRDRRAEAK
nr:hypothetical protein CPGR_01932 [Mycolicibacterium komanii]